MKAPSGPPARASFAEEKKFLWLPLLLNAYWITDKGVQSRLKKEKKRGRKLACKKGCSNCCRAHTDIPVYPIELAGIYWYMAEKIDALARRQILENLATRKEKGSGGPPCPFLVDGACAIHVIRPMACRHFNVLDTPCAPGEDPFFARREDVAPPSGEYTHNAFAATLPFYGIGPDTDEILAVGRLRNTQAVNLIEYNWTRLVEILNQNGSTSK